MSSSSLWCFSNSHTALLRPCQPYLADTTPPFSTLPEPELFFLSPPTATQGPTANPKVATLSSQSKLVRRRCWGGQGGTQHFVWCQCVFCAIAEWLTEFLRRPDNALAAFFFFLFPSPVNRLSGRLSHLVTVPVSASLSKVAPRLPALCHLLPGSRVAAVPYGMRHVKVAKTAGRPVCHTERTQKLI